MSACPEPCSQPQHLPVSPRQPQLGSDKVSSVSWVSDGLGERRPPSHQHCKWNFSASSPPCQGTAGEAEGHPPQPPSLSTLWEPQRCSSQDHQQSSLWLAPGLHTAAQVTWWAGDFQESGENQRPLILDSLFS